MFFSPPGQPRRDGAACMRRSISGMMPSQTFFSNTEQPDDLVKALRIVRTVVVVKDRPDYDVVAERLIAELSDVRNAGEQLGQHCRELVGDLHGSHAASYTQGPYKHILACKNLRFSAENTLAQPLQGHAGFYGSMYADSAAQGFAVAPGRQPPPPPRAARRFRASGSPPPSTHA